MPAGCVEGVSGAVSAEADVFLGDGDRKPYPKELEQVDAGQLSDWQQTFLEVQNRHLAAIQNEEGQLAFYEEGEARDQALDRFLEQEKQQYRTMIMGVRLKNA